MDVYVSVRTLKFCQGWVFVNSLPSKSFPATTVFTHFEKIVTHTPKNEVRIILFCKWQMVVTPFWGVATMLIVHLVHHYKVFLFSYVLGFD